MSKINMDYINKFNIKLGWGFYFEYDVFKKEIEPYLNDIIKIISYDYISVIKEGELNFCHYGPSGIKEINPSILTGDDCNLTLCSGVYCYNSETHIPFKCKEGTSLYYGKYIGKYVECVFDSDGDGIDDKGTGNLKEYVILTDTPIRFEKELKF